MRFFEKFSLRTILMVLTAASTAFVVSGVILPSSSNAQGNGSFLLTLNPSSTVLAQGDSQRSTITLISLNGFTGTVTIWVMYTGQILPVTIQDSTMTLPVGGSAVTTLTVNVPVNAPLGSYGIIVTGQGIGHKKTLSSSGLLSVEVSLRANFNIQADPSTLNSLVGSTNSTSIILTSLNSFNETVTLAATVPFGFIGVMGGQNPVSLPSNGTASVSLQISTTSNTLPGSYMVTVTGTSGIQSRSVTITINVTRSIVERLILISYNFATSTNLTLNLQNTGGTQITLRSYTVRDVNRNVWALSNWSGPSLSPGGTASASILIWADCASLGCYYAGIPGMFNEFVVGRSYTIVLTTDSGAEFTFNVTR